MNWPPDSKEAPDLAGRIPLGEQSKPLAALVADIIAIQADLMPAELSGIHNPWGVAARFTDPWAFLESCERPMVVDAVRKVLGEDIILWDSALFLTGADYEKAAPFDTEGRYWPVEPLQGAVAILAPEEPVRLLCCMRQDLVSKELDLSRHKDQPVLVIRYMSAASRFVRDADHPANRRCMEEQVLINYANQPLWLVSGENSGHNDLVTGFAPPIPTWAKTIKPTA